MNVAQILVIFEDTPAGHRRLAYASSLSSLLALPLRIVVPYLEMERYSLRGSQHDPLFTEELTRIRSVAAYFTKAHACAFTLACQDTEGASFPFKSLVVHDAFTKNPNLLYGAIASLGEGSLFRGSTRKIMIPIGNKASGVHAALYVLPIAKQMNASVIFYHATWRQSGCDSVNPHDHVCNEASRMLYQAEQSADDFGVKSRSVVETPLNVAESICKMALREDCGLIALTRGQNTLRGSYVDQVLDRSAVPVLVAPGEEVG